MCLAALSSLFFVPLCLLHVKSKSARPPHSACNPLPSGLYFAHLESNMLVTYMLFFGYMGIICLGMFLLCGSTGFFACLWFTRKIYASIKVD